MSDSNVVFDRDQYVFFPFPGHGSIVSGSIITSAGVYVPKRCLLVVNLNGDTGAVAAPVSEPANFIYGRDAFSATAEPRHLCTTCGREHAGCCGACPRRPGETGPAEGSGKIGAGARRREVSVMAGVRDPARAITGEDLDKVVNNANLAAKVMEAASLAEDGQQTGVLNKLLGAAAELTRENMKIMEEWGVV